MHVKLRIFVSYVLLTLIGCGPSSSSKKEGVNFEYWSSKPGYICAKMGGKNYCFNEKSVVAKSWETDPAPRFLINMPISAPELIECNSQRYLLNHDKSPSVLVDFGHGGNQRAIREMTERYGDTPRAVFESMNRGFYYGGGIGKSGDIIFPHQSVNYYGMKCVKTKQNSTYHQEFECHGGSYAETPPPHFFSCDRNGSVPFPGCSNWMFYKNLDFGISYSKKCAPYNASIRRLVVKYIDRMELIKGGK